MKRRSLDINIPNREIPEIVEAFLNIVGLDYNSISRISKEHKFYRIIKYCADHKNEDWSKINRPQFIYDVVDDVLNFYLLKPVLDRASKGQPVKLLLSKDMIHSLCVEAMLAVQYIKRGYLIKWLSPFSLDPPDIQVYDQSNKIQVDIEVKTISGKATVQSMFNSFSKGYLSLKKIKKAPRNPGVIVVHSIDNLGWENWLKCTDVESRLRSRFEDKGFDIVSGVVFSGGAVTNSDAASRQKGIPYAAFNSHVAAVPLPKGFLTSSGTV